MLSRDVSPVRDPVAPTIPIIVGATASGKTGLALELAQRLRHLHMEVVTADSRQIYRSMRIGTAQPTERERSHLPHHLIDFLDPADSFSAGQFRREAEKTIADILTRGAMPCVVGGTGLYLRALTQGLSSIPPVPTSVTARLREELASEGLAVLYGRVRCVDPDAAAAIEPGDQQRTIRALAVWEATGKPLSEWWRDPPEPPRYRYAWLGLRWERERLRERIKVRTGNMVAAGLENEVRALRNAGYTWETNALKTVGYREWQDCFDGQATEADVVQSIFTHTAQYAKRQMTWFNAVEPIQWLDAAAPDCVERAWEWLRPHVDRAGNSI